MIQQELFRLLRSLPPWELDELRRYLAQGRLTPADDQRTLALIQQHYHCAPADSSLVAQPLAAADLVRFTAGPATYYLAGITVQGGCGLLPARAHLPVDPVPGLQLYTGRNGSGKSSYTRLLRAAGRARTGTAVLPDVFATGKAGPPAAATFAVQVEGQARKLAWQQGQAAQARLPVAVYDHECSKVYVEDGNVAEVLPGGLDLFAVLAEARKRLKAALTDAAARLERSLPALPAAVRPGTEAYALLSGEGNPADAEGRLRVLAQWGPAQEARLAALRAAAADSQAARLAYARQVEQLEGARLAQHTLAAAATTVAGLAAEFGPALQAELTELPAQVAAARTAIAAAQARAAATQATAHVAGTGTPEWLALVRAAQAFSERYAYPGQAFPAVEPGCACVLCRQPLGPDAATWLQAVAAALAQVCTANGAANDASAAEVRAQQERLAQAERALAATVRRFDLAAAQLRQVLALPAVATADGVAANGVAANGTAACTVAVDGVAVDSAVACCQQAIAALERAAGQAHAGAYAGIDCAAIVGLLGRAGDALAALASRQAQAVHSLEAALAEVPAGAPNVELEELETRQWLNAHAADLTARPRQLQQLGALRAAANDLGTTQLTTLSKRVASELVEHKLIDRLHAQLELVGLGYLTARPASSGRAGVTTIRLAPTNAAFKKVALDQVLSEGEQALLGLAAFLAELDLAGHCGPLVFDDPVSGLDADNRALIAQRLAQLAATRQVLVFTHDEDFADELRFAADRAAVACCLRAVQRSGGAVGVVVEGEGA